VGTATFLIYFLIFLDFNQKPGNNLATFEVFDFLFFLLYYLMIKDINEGFA